MDLVRVLWHTIDQESGGRFDALQANGDGAGLSFGLLQWTQASGGLGHLLSRMLRTHPDQVRAALGPDAAAVVRTLTASSESARKAPVAGSPLWSAAWRPRFALLGQDPVLQADQVAELRQGDHMRGAVEALGLLGIPSSRALALTFDRAIQQGPNSVVTFARSVSDRGLAADERLVAFAERCRRGFRRRSLDDVKEPARWRQADDGTFHKFAGSVDLYADIGRRTAAILYDPDLSDVVAASAPAT